MAAAKIISIAWPETAKTIYCIIRRKTDSYRLNDANGAFAANPADPYLSLSEDAVIKGLYEVSESRTVWNDGIYLVVIYKQSGANPAPVTDTIIGAEEMYISDDIQIIVSELIVSGVTVDPIQVATGVLDNMITVTDNAPVTVIRGDVKTLTFNLGTSWNLTSKKVYFIAKASRTAANTTAIINKECTVTDAINGVATITFTATESGTIGVYYAEVEVRDNDGTSNPLTAMQFKLIVSQDVRQ